MFSPPVSCQFWDSELLRNKSCLPIIGSCQQGSNVYLFNFIQWLLLVTVSNEFNFLYDLLLMICLIWWKFKMAAYTFALILKTQVWGKTASAMEVWHSSLLFWFGCIKWSFCNFSLSDFGTWEWGAFKQYSELVRGAHIQKNGRRFSQQFRNPLHNYQVWKCYSCEIQGYLEVKGFPEDFELCMCYQLRFALGVTFVLLWHSPYVWFVVTKKAKKFGRTVDHRIELKLPCHKSITHLALPR